MGFIDDHRERFGVELICRVLTEHGVKIAPSGYHAAKTRAPSTRSVRDAAVLAGPVPPCRRPDRPVPVGAGCHTAPVTMQPVAPPHPLTVAEYLAIGEIEPGYSELVEGRLVMCASPVFGHQRFLSQLWLQVQQQLPTGLVAVQDLDLDLQFVPPSSPGTVRRPDLVVATREAELRLRHQGGVLRASEVVLVAEVVSQSSVRTDHVVKRGEYADAGIPHYWIVDLDDPVSLVDCHLAGDFGYRDGGGVTGVFTATAPFAVEIDLDSLR